MQKGVYIIPDNKCVGEYEDLAIGYNRGRCDTDTGNIYIRESALCEHLLVHEYIHRLSRNYINGEWNLGIGFSFNLACSVDFNGINELLTEWLAYKITMKKENDSIYQMLFPIIDIITNKRIYRFCNRIPKAYFRSDYRTIIKIFDKVFKRDGMKIIISISDCFTCPDIHKKMLIKNNILKSVSKY